MLVDYPVYTVHAQHDYDDGGVTFEFRLEQTGGVNYIDPQDIVDYVEGLMSAEVDLMTPVSYEQEITTTNL